MLSIKKILYFVLVLMLCSFYSCYNPDPCEAYNPIDPNFRCQPVLGTFIDARDSTTYETVTVCNQTWMAENLTYNTSDTSQFILNDSMGWSMVIPNFDTVYGNKHWYNFASAQYACPNGWHLPSSSEWSILEINLGMSPQDTTDHPFYGRACGLPPIFMSTIGWNGRGTNTSKFNLKGPTVENLWTTSFYSYYLAPSNSDVRPVYKSFSSTALLIHNDVYKNIASNSKYVCCIRCIKN